MRLMRSNGLLLFTPLQLQLSLSACACLTPRHRAACIASFQHTPTQAAPPPPLAEILVVLPCLSRGRESTSPLGYSWGAVLPHAANTGTACMCKRTRRHTPYLNERRRRRQQNETYSPRTDLWLRGGSSSAGSSSPSTDQRAAPPRLLALTAPHRNQLIKRRCRLSSAAIWKESFLSFIVFFFFSSTHCLFVSLLCFLCPLLRQQCRWIGTVSVRDLHVIS